MTKREKLITLIAVEALGIAAYFIFREPKKEKKQITLTVVDWVMDINTNDFRKNTAKRNITAGDTTYEILIVEPAMDTVTNKPLKTKSGKDSATAGFVPLSKDRVLVDYNKDYFKK